MTPNQISVLLHYRVFADNHPQANELWYKNSIRHLVASDLLDPATKNLTPRGERYVSMLLETPLPIAGWLDPRDATS